MQPATSVWLSTASWLPAVLVAVGCSGARVAPDPELGVEVEKDVVRIHHLDRLVLEYRRSEQGLKPYLRRLVSPGGVELLQDGPSGHEHHHGLMLAVGVDEVEYWGERYAEVPGRQVERALEYACVRRDDGEWWACLSTRVDWLDPRDERVQLEEERALCLRDPAAGSPLLLTWRSRLALPAGAERAVLWGRPYFGLGLRFAAPFDGAGTFANADGLEGELVRGDERLVSSRWCAFRAEIEGRPVTVAMLDHPRNPRHPARWFTMAEPFAYLSATLDLADRPLTLERELELVYGLAVWDGRATAADVEALHATWARRWGSDVHSP